MDKEVEDAIKAAEESAKEIAQGIPFKVVDISESIQDLLTDKAKEALKKPRAMQLTILDEKNCVMTLARFLGTRTETRSEGAYKIAKLINELVEEYDVKSILSLPCQIPLVSPNEDMKKTVATVFYFHLDLYDADRFMKHKFSLNEGQAPDMVKLTEEEQKELKATNLLKLDEEGFDGSND